MLSRRWLSPRRDAAGWTLPELMMIVGLIAVLLAVALPMYSNYRNKIRINTACRDIAVMSITLKTYREDNGAFPPDLAAVGLDKTVDPWGRPYAYYDIEANGRGHARKDRALNPLNTDFDLYSVGADGVTKSQISNKDSLDDVIRARNGDCVGLADNF